MLIFVLIPTNILLSSPLIVNLIMTLNTISNELITVYQYISVGITYKYTFNCNIQPNAFINITYNPLSDIPF